MKYLGVILGDGSPAILKYNNGDEHHGEWIASFADEETRDAVLAMLIERDEVE